MDKNAIEKAIDFLSTARGKIAFACESPDDAKEIDAILNNVEQTLEALHEQQAANPKPDPEITNKDCEPSATLYGEDVEEAKGKDGESPQGFATPDTAHDGCCTGRAD